MDAIELALRGVVITCAVFVASGLLALCAEAFEAALDSLEGL